MKVLMLGTYRFEGYSRAKVLYKGLIQNNINTELFLRDDKLRYFKIIKRLIEGNYDIILANGRIVLFLTKFFSRKPVIFDFFISAYDTQVIDRKLVKENSLRARILRLLDKYSCEFSDLAIMINEAYLNFVVNEFKVPREKCRVLAKGADDSVFYPKKIKKESKDFIVEFHGSFIPLHGIETIIDAAEILKDKEDIKFMLIGRGQMFDFIEKKIKEKNLKNISLLGWVKYENLPEYMSKADVCLGIFGTTEKASRCITHKVFEAIAMGKSVITEKNDAVKNFFKDGENIVLCEAGNPKQLAEKILLLKNNKQLREAIGRNAYNLYTEKFTPGKIGKELKNILEGKVLST